MNDVSVNETYQDLDPELIRDKLIEAVESWSAKLPEIMKNGKSSKMSMQEKMMLNTFQPFLPFLSERLTNSIDDASDEQILKLVQMLGDVHTWLIQND